MRFIRKLASGYETQLTYKLTVQKNYAKGLHGSIHPENLIVHRKLGTNANKKSYFRFG
ncbi:hypothetical protein NC99_04720 [Sunxiuqinia dokdonensis]|uniref:Uncharacterized protein n=1 Tax=Sunxiuqinia dokdonensis TaxID=1409788 RepID=A0A0L8VE72_9BACT|nr:hypothetical protein NC99_04720 [Sunxiuqinia dokdonensis]